MNRLAATLLVIAASTAAALAAPPRFALVKVSDIYRELPSTTAFQQSIQQQRDDIMKNERAEEFRKSLATLQDLQNQLQDKNAKRDDAANRKLAQEFEIKRQEAQTLQQEFENYRNEQTRLINTRIVTEMRKSLDQIVALSQKIAKEKGYDGVFDSSGETNTAVPFILYSKSAPDISEDVKALIKDSTPAPAPAPTPAPAKP